MAVFRATIRYYNPFLVSLLPLVLFLPNFHQTDAQIGVCNGRLGNNLPSSQEVVQLYKSNGIRRMRMYAPNPQALQALRGSGIELVLDVPNSDLDGLANDDGAAARKWVQDNVLNYDPDVKFRIIAVGNEVNPNGGETARLAPFVLPTMSKIYNAIASAGLKDQIKVSTVTYSALVSNSFPPSRGSFDGASGSFMGPIINFLKNTNNPLLFNIYPTLATLVIPKTCLFRMPFSLPEELFYKMVNFHTGTSSMPCWTPPTLPSRRQVGPMWKSWCQRADGRLRVALLLRWRMQGLITEILLIM